MGLSVRTRSLKTINSNLFSFLGQATALSVFLFNSISFAASGISYHGRILRPDGVTPVTSATTQFRIQVRTPGGENCLLWEEQQTKDLSLTNGVFSVTINDTSEPTLIPNALPYPIERVFSNRTAFTSLTGCSFGSAYTPSTSADGRSLQVQFRESPTDPWEQMPLMKVNYVPLALNSAQLEGYVAADFLKIDPASAYTPLSAANVNTLVDIISGNSNLYLKPATSFSGDVTGVYNSTVVERIRGTGVVATAPTSGQVLKFNGTSWAPAADDTGTTADASYTVKGVVQINTDLATSGLFIAGGVLALPNVITAGTAVGDAQNVPVITYDQKGRLTAVSTIAIDDTTKLPLAGGTMTGAINMGGQNITNATSMAATNFSGRNLILSDNDTNTATIKAPANLPSDYILTLPNTAPVAGAVLSTDASGNLSWIAAASGSVTGITSTNAYLTVDSSAPATPALTLNVGVAANTVAAGDDARIVGALQASAYNADLAPAALCTTAQTPYWNTVSDLWACQNISVANFSGNLAGDVTGTQAATVVERIRGTNVVATVPLTGQVLKFDGTNYVPSADAGLTAETDPNVQAWAKAAPNGIFSTSGDVLNITARIPSAAALPAGGQDGQTLRWNNTSSLWEWFTPGVAGSGFNEGGNTFGAAATLGTNDNYALNFETNGATRMALTNDGALLLSGTSGVTPTSGAGTRMMWIPAKAAFRAGTALGPEWDDANVGNASVGFGFGSHATGFYSVVSGGLGNRATGEGAVASGGSTNIVSGQMATSAGGYGNTVSGDGAIVMGGNTNLATGVYSAISGGTQNIVHGDYSWAGGRYMRVGSTADRTFIWGYSGAQVSVSQADAFIIYSGDVGIGNLDPTSKLDVSGAITQRGMAAPAVSPAGQGRIYFDSTSNKLRVSQNGAAYTDLVASGGITSLGGQSGSTQTFAVNATGLAPAINSASDVHTLSIPLASGAGVTSGTISKTDYDLFNAKLTSPLTTKGDLLSRDGTTHVRLPAGTDGQVLSADSAEASGLKWITAASGDITSVVAGAGLVTGGTTGDVTLDVAAGTGIVVNANDVAVDVGLASGKIPQVGGTALGANGVVIANGTGNLASLNCTIGQVIKFDVSGYAYCGTDEVGTGAFVNNGNSFAAPAVLGTNDNNTLAFETNATTKMTLTTGGNLGINNTTPQSFIDIAVPIADTSRSAEITLSTHDQTYAQPSLLLLHTRPNFTSGYGSAGVGGWKVASVSGSGGSGGMAADFVLCSKNGTASENCQLHIDYGTGNMTLGGSNASAHLSSKVSVNGNMTVGATWTNWSTYQAAPTNSLIVEGMIGAGLSSPATALDVNGAISARGIAAPALSPAGQGRMYFDSTSNTFRISQNGGAYQEVTVGGFMNGGNSYGAAATLGTNDNFALNFETNNTSRMTILNNGNIGFGASTNPTGLFEISATTLADGSTGKSITMNAQSSNEAGGDITLQSGYRDTRPGGALVLGGSGWTPTATSLSAADGDTNGSPGNLRLKAGHTINNGGGYVNITGGGTVNGTSGSVFITPGTSTAAFTYGNVILGVDNAGAVTQSSTVVERIRGTNVVVTAPTTGQVLKFDGANYVPSADAGLTAETDPGVQAWAKAAPNTIFSTTGDVLNITARIPSAAALPAGGQDGQTLRWNNTTSLWEWFTPGVAGSGFNQGGNTFGADATLGTNDNFALNFETNSATRMTILNDGKVGIGTPSPIYSLDVASEIRTKAGLGVQSGAGNVFWNYSPSPNLMSIGGIGSNPVAGPLNITNIGNVGIGTNAPSTTLDINGAATQRGMAAPALSLTGQGRIYFDSTSNKFRVSQNGAAYTDLVASGGITSLGGQSGSTQTFAVNATGLAPAINSASDVHTLSIPLASGAGVTSGTISKTEYDLFNAKLTSPLTTKGDLLARDATSEIRLPAGTDGQVLSADSAETSGLKWITAATGDITSVVAGAGLITGGTTGDVTLDVAAGTGIVVNANDVAIDSGLGASKVPMVGGVALGANGVIVANGTATALTSLNCTLNQIIKFDVSGYSYCGTDEVGTGAFVNGGNSFGAAATIGTNDNFGFNIETNNTARMNFTNSGFMGIYTTAPRYALDLRKNGTTGGALFATGGVISDNNPYTSVEHSNGLNYSAPLNVITSGADTTGGIHVGVAQGYGETPGDPNYYAIITERNNNNGYWDNGARGAVASGDYLPGLAFAGQSNNQQDGMVIGAAILGRVDGAVSTATVPTSLVFRTSATNSAGLAERLRITSAGNVGIGNIAPTTILDINGATTQRGMAAPALSPAGQGRIYFDSTSNKFRVSQNGGAFADLAVGATASNIDGLSDAIYTTGSANMFFGTTAGTVASGTNNIGIGHGTMPVLSTGTRNVAIGTNVMNDKTTSYDTVAIGNNALYGGGNASYSNVAIGATALFSNSGAVGNFNVAIGTDAGSQTTNGSYNVFVGSDAGENMVDTSSRNVAVGYQALNSGGGNENVAIGYYAGNATTGGSNVFVGNYIFFTNAGGSSGTNNTIIGHDAASTNTNRTASNNVGMGKRVLKDVTTGNQNTILGAQAGNTITTGSDNILVGYNVQTPAVGTNEYLNIGNLLYGNLAAADRTLDLNGALNARGRAAPAVSAAGQGKIYFDSTSNKFRVSQNGGAFADLVPAGGSGDIANGGNSFGAAATIGTNDNFALNFETNSSTRMTVLPTGEVGIGTASPSAKLDVSAPYMYLLNRTAGGEARYRLYNSNSAAEWFLGQKAGEEDFTISKNSGGETVFMRIAQGGALTANTISSNGTFRTYLAGSGDVSISHAGLVSSMTAAATVQLALGAGGSEAMRINTSGSVGVGTTSPLSKLHLVTPNSAGLMMTYATNGDYRNSIDSQFFAGSPSTTRMYFSVSNGTATGQVTPLTLLGNSNVGIGTTTPATVLDVNGAQTFRGVAAASAPPTAAQGKIYFDSTANKFKVSENNGAYVDLINTAASASGTAGHLQYSNGSGGFSSDSSQLFWNATDNRLGIGTASPENTLHVLGRGKFGTFTGFDSGADLMAINSTGSYLHVGSSNNDLLLGTDYNNSALRVTLGDLQFRTGGAWNANAISDGTIRMTILSGGNVGIGPSAPAARLDVVDTGTTTSAIIVPRAAAFTGTTVNGMVRYNSTSNLFEFYQNGAWVNYTTVSDARLKTNVTAVTKGLDVVNQLNPVFYDWDQNNPRTKSFGDKHQVGFIAQEVEKVLPEVVNVGEDSYRSVEYGKMVAVVVAAVKELYTKFLGHEEQLATQARQIATIQSENEKLKQENAAIKAFLCSKDPKPDFCK